MPELGTITVGIVVAVVFEALGVILAIRAVHDTRTAQGAIAWAVALVSMPVPFAEILSHLRA